MPTSPSSLTPGSKPAKKTGAQLALQALGLNRAIDFALHLPLRYEDETKIHKLRSARIGDTVQIAVKVCSAAVQPRPRRQLLVHAKEIPWPLTSSEESTSTRDSQSTVGLTCALRFFYFYPAQQKSFDVGSCWLVRGSLQRGTHGFEIVHPNCKPLLQNSDQALPTHLTPVYPSTGKLAQNYLRKAIEKQLQRADLRSTLPLALEQNAQQAALAWSFQDAVRFLHTPPANTDLHSLEMQTHPAWQRLVAEELLAQQLSQKRSQQKRQQQKAPALAPDLPKELPMVEALLALLPFKLTAAQQRVQNELAADLQSSKPMHRLLQGDVGSGKTVLAALACAQAIGAGYQCALMVPTELLAEQHFRKLTSWLSQLEVKVAWMAGSQKKSERQSMLQSVADGTAPLVVGTHAVISKEVSFAKLGLVVIDEQHRFGVEQRLILRFKNQTQDLEPHFLMMSATPIPRTLAMSYYADLDVSIVDELPPGRQVVQTKLISMERKHELIERIQAQVQKGRQAYWVCPLIEESEALDLSTATATHALLQEALYSDKGLERRVGLLHSRMPSLEKKYIMQLFVQGRIQVLVSTTVIEVGLDVPQASLMVIEHAERFGLSQLHQLRGRVGRGDTASTCILLYSKGEHGRLGQAAQERLRAMLQSNDGFEIARQDLAIRGPGEFLGARQSGQALLRFADPERDSICLEWARKTAPLMLQQHPQEAKRHMQRWLGNKSDYWDA